MTYGDEERISQTFLVIFVRDLCSSMGWWFWKRERKYEDTLKQWLRRQN
jgi:hypothetical protein